MKIMKKMGFHTKRKVWICKCISFVSFSIMVTGEPRGHIVPTRGLRQGEPLSFCFFYALKV